jgi:hypothetical protein
MANVYAVKTGNWSDTTVWNTGVLPTSADIVYSNNYIVTIDASPTVLALTNLSASGITQGGYFSVTSARTITCTGTPSFSGFAAEANIAGYSQVVIVNTGPSVVCTITANPQGHAGTLTTTGNGTTYLIGNTRGFSYPSYGPGLAVSGSSTVYMTGNSYGWGGAGTAISVASGAVINLTGNVYGSQIGGDNAPGIYVEGTAIITGLAQASGGTTTRENCAGIKLQAGTLTHVGSVIASVYNFGIEGGSGSYTASLSGPFIDASNARKAVYLIAWKWVGSPSATYWEIRTNDLASTRKLYSSGHPDAAVGQPAASNVRSGTAYGPASELTGTCVVPNPNSVGYGVPVDNTTGTAVLSASAAKEACSKAIVPALIALG